MYTIYFANMAKATGIEELKKRPVVVIGKNKSNGKLKVIGITGRNRNGMSTFVHMDSFKLHGYCDVSHFFEIDKKYLMDYRRACTPAEESRINEGIKMHMKNSPGDIKTAQNREI